MGIQHRHDTIDCLKEGRDLWTSDHNTIISKIHDHFKKIFTTSNPSTPKNLDNLFPTNISVLENDFLCSIPTEEDIALIVRQLLSSKAPGLDGFTGLFYKTYWEVIKIDLIAGIQSFFFPQW